MHEKVSDKSCWLVLIHCGEDVHDQVWNTFGWLVSATALSGFLRKYFHSTEASERQPRWTAVMSNDVGAAAEYPSAPRPIIGCHHLLLLHLKTECNTMWNPAWAHASKIVANGPKNYGPFQEGRSCALGRRCTILSHRRPSSHEGLRADLQNRNFTPFFLHAATISCERVARRPPKSQFHVSFWHSTTISHERVARRPPKSQFHLSFRLSTTISRERAARRPPKSQFHLTLSFWHSTTISCERVAPDTSKSQFHHSFAWSKLVSCERVAPQVRNFTSVFGDRTSFRAKGLQPTLQNRKFISAFGDQSWFRAKCLPPIEARFVRKSCRRDCKIAILPQFLAMQPRFVRKGCVSCRLVGTAPPLKREIEKKEKEEGTRARGQERMWRCEDVRMWGCEDVRMWGCEDVKMRRCEDVRI